MNLNKAPQYCGMFKHDQVLCQKLRDILINAGITDKVRKVSSKRPTYGTRRMTVQIARKTGSYTS